MDIITLPNGISIESYSLSDSIIASYSIESIFEASSLIMSVEGSDESSTKRALRRNALTLGAVGTAAGVGSVIGGNKGLARAQDHLRKISRWDLFKHRKAEPHILEDLVRKRERNARVKQELDASAMELYNRFKREGTAPIMPWNRRKLKKKLKQQARTNYILKNRKYGRLIGGLAGAGALGGAIFAGKKIKSMFENRLPPVVQDEME